MVAGMERRTAEKMVAGMERRMVVKMVDWLGKPTAECSD